MLAFIFSRLLAHTFISGILGVILGSVVGVIAGAIRRSIPDTFVASCMGAFLGCILVCITPWVAAPGTLETWGQGGGLGSLVVLMTLAFIALGGLVGSLVTSTFGYRWVCQLKLTSFQWILAGIYLLMIVSLAYGYRQGCSPSLSYC